jgi:alpha-1,2-mannosyltransferase
MPDSLLRPFPLLVLATVAITAGIIAFTAGAGGGDSMILAWIAAGVAAVYAWRQPAVAAAMAAAPRPARIAFGVGALALLPQLALLSVFIVDPKAGVWPAYVWRPIASQHSCVSAYWVAARAATRVPNLYVESVYRPPIVPAARPVPNLGPFIVDVFEYPPTFLPLPRLLGLVSPDFWTFRRLWFALNLAGVAVGLVAIGRRLDTRLGTPAVWLTPFALAAPAVVGTLQAGNLQLLVIVIAAVAMLLFERRQHAAGGLLLGYAIASKLFPGVLLLFLLLRRDWRALGWTAAVGAALVLVTLADVGWTPFAAFFDNLPKLLSGEAFPGLRNAIANAIAINESVPGLVFKLGLFGVPDMSFAASKIVGWVYTLVVIGATAWMALYARDRAKDPLLWIAILLLATLRSPFLPFYAVFPPLWLATLIVAVAWRRTSVLWSTIAMAIVLSFTFGTPNAVPPQVNAIATLTHTIAALVLAVMAARLAREQGPVAVAAPAQLTGSGFSPTPDLSSRPRSH